MKNIICILSLLFLFLTVSSCAEDLVEHTEQGVLKGKVVKKGSNEPVANVKISTAPSTQTLFTDKDGMFVIKDIPTGNYSVKAELNGFLTSYEAVTIQTGQEVSVIIELSDDQSLNSPPSAPELLSPIDNALDQPLSVQLSWNSTDPDKSDSLTYKLIVKNNVNTDIITINDISDKFYTLDNLSYGTSYFWQVAVSDGIHPEVFSSVFKFTTTATPSNRYHYVKKQNGNFYIVSSDLQGNSFNLTQPTHNSWRPRKNNNANRIAFLRTEGSGSHIYTVKPDGSDLFKVTTTPVAGFHNSELDFSWNTDGSKLIYTHFDKLYQINKDGTGLQLLYTTPDGSFISECDWSYNNAHIALKTNDVNGYNIRIFVIDLLGNTVENVFTAATGAAGGLNFSIDGQKLLYTYDVSGHLDTSYRQLDSRLFLYNFQTNSSVDISVESSKPQGTNDLDPRFSPDNSQIILMNTSNDNISARNIVFINMNSSGTNFLRVPAFNNGEMPDFE